MSNGRVEVSAALDDVALTDVVRNALSDPTAEVENWDATEIHGSLGQSARIYRVTGQARATTANEPWSIVVKIFNSAGVNTQIPSHELKAWDYWKREVLAYQSTWMKNLSGPFVAPTCYGSGDADGAGAWVAMEDLTAADLRPWPLDTFGTVARHLGAFNAGYLVGSGVPNDPWLSDQWIRGWTDRAGTTIDLIPKAADHPLASLMCPADCVEPLLRLWEKREAVYDALAALPQTLCHGDVSPHNMFIRSNGTGEQSVAIDWAFCGRGPIGQELASLVGASLAFNEADIETAEELESRCLQDYISGLQNAGWDGDPADAEFGYLASHVLRYGVGGLGITMSMVLVEAYHPMIEAAFGAPIDQMVTRVGQYEEFLHPRVLRVMELVAGR